MILFTSCGLEVLVPLSAVEKQKTAKQTSSEHVIVQRHISGE